MNSEPLPKAKLQFSFEKDLLPHNEAAGLLFILYAFKKTVREIILCSLNLIQSLLQISNDVTNVFNANAEAQKIGCHTGINQLLL